MALIYFLVAFLATVFGSLAGLGGGVIIRPVLDLIQQYDVATVGILSASTVFAMALVSLLTYQKQDAQINYYKSTCLAIGSVLGGVIGKYSFQLLFAQMVSHDLMTVFQSLAIGLLMLLILIYMRKKQHLKTYQLNNFLLIVAIGFVLGLIAAFLGIGGGPFNMAVLFWLFSMRAKESALNSIFIIFFSQLASLLLTLLTTGFSEFDLSMLIYMIPGGILGGFLGTRISKHVNEGIVEKIFSIGIMLIITICIVNIIFSLK